VLACLAIRGHNPNGLVRIIPACERRARRRAGQPAGYRRALQIVANLENADTELKMPGGHLGLHFQFSVRS
jgi:hypothetical protein